MTPEIVRRVDAWLARRAGSALGRRWSALASTWADQQISALPEDAEATAAAMGGVLLALVREAEGRDVFVEHHGDGLWRVHQQHREYVIGVGLTEHEALLHALESAS
jgi:hypothetical protein